jgi:hypothetical protein
MCPACLEAGALVRRDFRDTLKKSITVLRDGFFVFTPGAVDQPKSF